MSVELDKGYIGDFNADDLKGLAMAMIAVGESMKTWMEGNS